MGYLRQEPICLDNSWTKQKHNIVRILINKKMMLTSLFGFIHNSFLNPGSTVIVDKYCPQINAMREEIVCTETTNLVNRETPIHLLR